MPLDFITDAFASVMLGSGLVVGACLAFIAVVMLTRRPVDSAEVFHIGTSGSDQRHAA